MKQSDVIIHETPWGEDTFCKKCGSSVIWVECENCGGKGVSGHDCGEDTCCCLYPEDNVTCDWCGGTGGHYECLGCDSEKKVKS